VEHLKVSLTKVGSFQTRMERAAGTNTLAYYKHLCITAVKHFIAKGPVPNVIKLFKSIIYEFKIG
jgi:hypothetical protein